MTTFHIYLFTKYFIIIFKYRLLCNELKSEIELVCIYKILKKKFKEREIQFQKVCNILYAFYELY